MTEWKITRSMKAQNGDFEDWVHIEEAEAKLADLSDLVRNESKNLALEHQKLAAAERDAWAWKQKCIDDSTVKDTRIAELESILHELEDDWQKTGWGYNILLRPKVQALLNIEPSGDGKGGDGGLRMPSQSGIGSVPNKTDTSVAPETPVGEAARVLLAWALSPGMKAVIRWYRERSKRPDPISPPDPLERA